MSRLIKTETAGKDRTRLSKSIVLAIRALMQQTITDDHTRDLAAYLVLALEAIAEGIEESVAAWEKRGYWVKADRFRMDWAWAGLYAAQLRESLRAENWEQIAAISVKTATKLSSVEVSPNHRLGEPWQGAYRRFITGSTL